VVGGTIADGGVMALAGPTMGTAFIVPAITTMATDTILTEAMAGGIATGATMDGAATEAGAIIADGDIIEGGDTTVDGVVAIASATSFLRITS